MKRVPKKRTSRGANPASGKAGAIRIIAGQWRGRRLPVRNAEGLRPTTDRNKETLFNWLMADIRDARCLDMFAGSGGLGLEALSRYADTCVFFEKDHDNAAQLQANLSVLSANADVQKGDALSLITKVTGTFDVIFIDPPFGQSLVQPALDTLFDHQKVTDQSLIYVEQEAQAPLPALPDGWSWQKQKSTSALLYGLIGKDTPAL